VPPSPLATSPPPTSLPMIVSFVSGKGGVGKTSLAANFAWICGRAGKTVLIDLDFQNQGCTGLFLASLPSDVCGAFDMLVGTEAYSRCQPVPVEDNVFFIPAVTIMHAAGYSKIAELISDRSFAERLQGFLDHLRLAFGYDLFVLDCHGGLDYVSVAAYALSDETIVVTETDTVTFNGTLELLDFYGANRPAARTAAPVSTPLVPQGAISFVVNRLPSKYRFQDLDLTYKRLIGNYRGDLNLRPAVLSFIPEEGFIAESFGEYPFCVKLAPKSVVARKLQLMMLELVMPGTSVTDSYKPFRRFRSERFRRKVRAITLSAESRNTNNIIYAFGWLSTGVTAIVGALAVYIIVSIATPTSGYKPGYKPPGLSVKTVLVLASFGLIFLGFLYYGLRAQFGLMFYYNDKYRFRRAINRATRVPLNLWQKLSLVRLWSLRLGTAIGPAVMIVFGLLMIFYLLLLLA
jgi:MinD-like ATPase involved in chromosome partitioning or flagellar assembly